MGTENDWRDAADARHKFGYWLILPFVLGIPSLAVGVYGLRKEDANLERLGFGSAAVSAALLAIFILIHAGLSRKEDNAYRSIDT